nr:DUF202 domain-containing protein [Parachlamydia sp. AcF125]
MAQERTSLAMEQTRLANQRTFLSWIRTGLAGVGGGIGVVRLLTFENPLHAHTARIVGIILILWGILIFILSLIEYKQNTSKLNLSYQGGISIQTFCILTFTLAVLSVALLFII